VNQRLPRDKQRQAGEQTIHRHRSDVSRVRGKQRGYFIARHREAGEDAPEGDEGDDEVAGFGVVEGGEVLAGVGGDGGGVLGGQGLRRVRGGLHCLI